MSTSGGFRQPAAAADHFVPLVQVLRVLSCQQIDVVTSIKRKRLVRRHRRAPRLDIVTRDQRHGTPAYHFAANAARLALGQRVIRIPDQFVAAPGGHIIERDIAARHQLRLGVIAAGDHLRAGQIEIAPGFQPKLAVFALYVNPGNTVDSGPRKAVFPRHAFRVAQRGRGVDIAPGADQQAVRALQYAADVIDISARGDTGVRPLDHPALVGDVIRVKLEHPPPGDGAPVKEIAIELHHDVVTGDQRA